MIKLDSLEDCIEDIKLGKPVILIDDKDRENEGDLMVAAQLTTAEIINFMIREGKGLICLSLTQERLKQLAIPQQVTENTAPLGTNFSVSIDSRSVIDYGVSAAGRAETIRSVMDETVTHQDFVMPGYVFPLCAKEGGVLKRRGQTEGSVDLVRLAGLKLGAVICEIMDEKGEMLAGRGLANYASKWGLKVTSVDAIARYRMRREVSLRRVAECSFADCQQLGLTASLNCLKNENKTQIRVLVYIDDVDDKEHVAFVVGEPKNGSVARIHSECLTGDVFESQRCDCGAQFITALSMAIEEGAGVVVYLHQEGRGIGLGNKLRAYELQEQGRDTVDANIELGFVADARDYRAGAQILADLGLSSVSLLTNNPAKVQSLEQFGINVDSRLPLAPVIDDFNQDYIRTKKERMGHLLPELG